MHEVGGRESLLSAELVLYHVLLQQINTNLCRHKTVYMYLERIESMVNWMLLTLGNFKTFD